MSTPPSSTSGTTSGVSETHLRSSPSPSRSLLTRTRPLSRANQNQTFSTLPPEPIHSVHSSPGDSTVDISHDNDYARMWTDSRPIHIRSHFPARGGGHGSTSAHTIANTPRDSILLSAASTSFDTSPTPSVILTVHHHDERKASSAPTSPTEKVSPPASLPIPVTSLGGHSDSPRYLPHQHHDPRGDVTPPNGVPRKWWSRSPSNERGRSVSPSRGRSMPFGRRRFRDPEVLAPGSDASLSTPDNFAEQETLVPSSLPDGLPLAPLSSDLPSLFYEDLPIRDLNERKVGVEDGGIEDSLLLSSPKATPANLVSPTSPTAVHLHPNLMSLGVGIEEGLRKDDRDNSYWPKLFGLSPKSSPKSPGADLGTSASPSETTLQVEEECVVSMETWDGKSLHVSPVVMSLGLSSPTEGKAPALLNQGVSPSSPHKPLFTSPGKGKGKGKVQDAPPKEPSTLIPQVQIKHPESWYDKFVRRQGAKGQEKESKENDSWLRARENVSLALNAVLPTSELEQLSDAGKAFAIEGHAARTNAEQENGREVEASSGAEKGAETENNQGAQRKVGTSEKVWLTVKSTVTTVSPMLRISLTILGDVSKLTPIPGLHEAARTLLAVWEAVDAVETNRLQCLRLTERCAMLIYSVRAEIADAEKDLESQQGENGDVGIVGLSEEMHAPVEKLNECIRMVYDFLLKLNRRPFIKRFLRSDEIRQEIQACDNALGDARQMFSISIQIRILKECKRFARERRLEAGHHAPGFTPPPLYASPPTQTLPISLDHTPRVGTQALPEPHDILLAASGLGRSPPAQKLLLPPVQSMQSQTDNTVPPSSSNDTPISPLAELQDLHSIENASDIEHDRALFHSTLKRAISARRADEVLQVMEVRPGEVPEALKALRRAEEALRRAREASERQGGDVVEEEALERAFMETGIEVMTRLSSVAVQKAEDRDVDVPWDLPPWTITRCWLLSKVYLGSWSGRRVAIKVLSSYTPASLFRKEVDIWRKLRHENVLRMWGASSAQGERPWFIVSEYCGGGSLVGWLKERKGRVGESNAGSALAPPSAGAKGDVDLLRCMHHISKGMVYLHDQNVLHGDLKASNVLVDDNGRCVISDFGQSEMKWEASRRSGEPVTNGTLRWQAPELLDGATKLTTATDVYAFSICCIEILGMGDLPYGHRDDALVALIVLDQDKRAEIPSTHIAPLVEPLIEECWVRDPEQRPSFKQVVTSLKRLRKRQGGVEESPVPVQVELLLETWPQPPHHSPTIYPLEPPVTSPSTLQDGQAMPDNDSDASLRDEFSTASEDTGEHIPGDMDSLSTTSCGSQPRPFRPIGRPCSNPSHRWEPIVDPLTGNIEMPEGRYSGTAIYTPSRKLSLAESDSMSSVSSHLTSSPEAEHTALEEVRRHHDSHHVAFGYESSLPMDEQLAERRNELRFRSLAQSSHGFHHSLTLPLWSPSHVELGAVGYLSAPKGEFITLFNAMEPQHTTGSKVTNIPSLGGYLKGNIQIGEKHDSIRTVAQRGLELISGLLTFPLIDRNESYSERILRRHPFPLRAGHKAAFIYTESTMYRFIKDLTAPREWFKANVNAIVKEYAPYHPIQKEDIIVVFGTLCAPEYALFVSHSHPNGQAHFNVFSDRESGRPWGTFTTDTEYPSDEGGPSYIEEIPRKAVFASKVSPVRMNARSNDKDWDTLVLARLRFPTDATEPTSQ
ncbi:hypothetical protein EDB19DRAFT_1715645 [Suillus lakei]|nr:hypothetical protein EDB19DRAFT_1715645 [Suillus lakei]